MKPDVTAPGESILSSIPPDAWDTWDGTSMATPHVAGAAALLKQRHPTWTVVQIKSALETTGDPVHVPSTQIEVASTREGGGRIDIPRADNPLIFTDPTGLSFGLVERSTTVTRPLATTDAGGGGAPWTVAVAAQTMPRGATLAPSATTVVAGSPLALTVTTIADAAEGEATGWVTLTRGTDVRRVPYWFRVEAPQLGNDPHTDLTRVGVYHGNTAGKASRVSSYRYPDRGIVNIPTDLSGPEQVFRFDLTKPVANFGAVVLSYGKGITVAPRIVHAGDENRLVGYAGLPRDDQPVRRRAVPVPRRRRDPAHPGRVRHRLRHARRRARRSLHLPLLGQRHDTARDPASSAKPRARRAGPTRGHRRRLGRRPGHAHRHGRRPGRAHLVRERRRVGHTRTRDARLAPARRRSVGLPRGQEHGGRRPVLPNTRTLRTTIVVR